MIRFARLVVGLMFALVAACAMDTGPSPEAGIAAHWSDVFPSMKSMLVEARGSIVETYADKEAHGLLVRTSHAVDAAPIPKPQARMVSRSLARFVEAILPNDAREPFALRERGATVLRVRRVNAGAASGKEEHGTVVYEEAFAGADAIVFAKETGIEELLVVKREGAVVAYDVELPEGWKLVQPPGVKWLVEMRDARGTARHRLKAGKAWDAAGVEKAVELAVEGTRIVVKVAGVERWPVLVDPEWQGTGSMASGRVGHAQTLLPNGKVLIVGGDEGGYNVELFDPAAGAFTSAGATAVSRHWATATVLQNGTVLIAGGNESETATEIYDVRANTFSKGAALTVPRTKHGALALPSGDVLVAGGCTTPICPVPDELFVANEARFQALPGQGTPVSPSLTSLPSGNVLITGGEYGSDNWVPPYGAIFDPRTRTYSTLGESSPGAALLLSSGQVLVGLTLYDPATNTFAEVQPLKDDPFPTFPLFYSPGSTLSRLPSGDVVMCPNASGQFYLPLDHKLMMPSMSGSIPVKAAATLLPSGSILITGGQQAYAIGPGEPTGPSLAAAQVLEPAQDSVTGIGALAQSRCEFSAVPLVSGDVLLEGGYTDDIDRFHQALHLTWAEVFDGRTLRSQTIEGLTERGPSWTSIGDTDDHILFAGGYDDSFNPLDTAYTYEVAHRRFVWSGRLLSALVGTNGVRIPSGRALLVPSADPNISQTLDAEVFDLATRSFTSAGHHIGGTATALASGKVLITQDSSNTEIFDPTTDTFQTGPKTPDGFDGVILTTLADHSVLYAGAKNAVYRPDTDTFEAVGDMVQARTYRPLGARLDTGDVLVVGGVLDDSDVPEVYQPSTKSFRSTNLAIENRRHGALFHVPDGRIAAVGGIGPWGASSQIDLFDSTGKTMDALSLSLRPYLRPTVATLSDGGVLISGGFSSPNQQASTPHADVFDPIEGTSKRVGDMITGCEGAIAVTVDEDRVFFVGGQTTAKHPTNTTQFFSRKTASFIKGPDLNVGRYHHAAVRLPSGKILVTGGTDGNYALASAEILDPRKSASQSISPMRRAREGHAAVLLANGKVLIAGGTNGTTQVADFEIYDPATESFAISGAGGSDVEVSGLPLFGSGALLTDRSTTRTIDPISSTSHTVTTSTVGLVDGQYAPGGKIALFGWRTLARFDPASQTLTEVIPSNIEWGPFSVLTRSGDILVGSNHVKLASGAKTTDPNPAKTPVPNLHFAHWSMVPAGVVRPVLDAVGAPIVTGQEFSLTGDRFTRISGVDGATSTPDPAIVPSVVFVPANRGIPVTATVTSWTDRTLGAILPPTVYVGPGWLFVLVESVPSIGQFVSVSGTTQGAACAYDGECGTGVCADGVCCYTTCGRSCEACSAERQDPSHRENGICLPAIAGSNFKHVCFDQNASSCGMTGTCDGKNPECGKYPDGIGCTNGGTCRSGACEAASSRCDDTGERLIDDYRGSFSCEAYRCRDGACLKSCASNLDCAPSFYCAADGHCQISGNADNGITAGCATAARSTRERPLSSALATASVIALAAVRRRRRRRDERRHAA